MWLCWDLQSHKSFTFITFECSLALLSWELFMDWCSCQFFFQSLVCFPFQDIWKDRFKNSQRRVTQWVRFFRSSPTKKELCLLLKMHFKSKLSLFFGDIHFLKLYWIGEKIGNENGCVCDLLLLLSLSNSNWEIKIEVKRWTVHFKILSSLLSIKIERSVKRRKNDLWKKSELFQNWNLQL